MINVGKKVYNNGKINKYFTPGEEPANFVKGKLPNKEGKYKIRLCRKCGKEFIPSDKNKYWCIECYNEVHKEVICPICNKKFIQKYQNEKTCSKKCAAILRGNFKDPTILKKIALTNLKKYGCENPWNNSDIQKKCTEHNDRQRQIASIKERTELRHSTPEYIEKERLKLLKSNSKQISHHELVIYDTLSKKFNIIQQYTFDDCVFKNKLRFDLFRPRQKVNIDNNLIEVEDLLIEYDGEQHYKPVRFNKISDSQMYKNFITCQIKDWLKDKYCIEHDINLIRVEPSKFNSSFEENWNKDRIVNKDTSNIIRVFDINDADFVNYKKATFMIYSGISCSFKCNKENHNQVCQNWSIRDNKVISIQIDKLIARFDEQNISKSISFQGLETLDNLKELLWFIYKFREKHDSEIIIWTGYTEEECEDFIYLIKNVMKWNNIIVKFGRFIPDQKCHYDDTLGVELASDNQYAVKIS